MNRPALLAALLALGACRDLPTTVTAPTATAPDPIAADRTPVRCAVAIAARNVSCAVPVGPRGIRSAILGGQGLNVRLVSRNVNFDDFDHVFSFDVTVQSLIDQPLGTDGTTDTGVRVFFNSGPTTTDGTGQVTVLTDSIGTFMAANQPYYKYDGVIQPRGVSQPQTWQFSIDPGVNTFEFIVYVEAAIPAESGILHWRPERGTQVYFNDIRGVWAASAHDVFAVSGGAVLHFDGNYWRAMDAAGCGCGNELTAVWGTRSNSVFAVGTGGTVVYWTGEDWDAFSDPDLGSDDLYAVWGSNVEDVWAVGEFGRIVHFNGSDWTTLVTDPVTTEGLYGVWGAGDSNVWAVGGAGTILHWDGASWTAQSLPDPVTLLAVWGTSATDVWAAGIDDGCGCGGGGGVLYHYDGAEWSAVEDGPDLTELPIFSGWSDGSGNVWLASLGVILHYDGADWTQEAAGYGTPFYGITGAGSNVFAVGSLSTIARNTGGGWQTMSLPDDDAYGIWGADASDVWAVGGSLIRRRMGGSWSWQPTPDGMLLNAVSGSGASDVWAVGDGGGVAHFDGASWSGETVDGVTSDFFAVWGSSSSDVWTVGSEGAVLHYTGGSWSTSAEGTGTWYGIWGSSATDVFLVGDAGAILRWNGTSWSPMNSGTTETLRGVWGSGPNDVYAVGDNGTVLHYDGNVSGDWTAPGTPADPASPVTAVWGSGANDVYMLTNFGLDLMRWDGATWRTVSSFSRSGDIRMYTLWGTGPTNIYAGGDLGTVLHGQR